MRAAALLTWLAALMAVAVGQAPLAAPLQSYLFADTVRAVAFDPSNATVVAAGGNMACVQLWDTTGTTGPPQQRCAGLGLVLGLVYNPANASELFILSYGGVALWPSSPALVAPNSIYSTGNAASTCMAVNPANAAELLTGDEKPGAPTVRAWSMMPGVGFNLLIAPFTTAQNVTSVAFNPFNTSEFAYGVTGIPAAHLAETATGVPRSSRATRVFTRRPAGRPIRSFAGHTGDVTAVAFNPLTPSELLTASRDRTLKLWNAATGAEIRTFVGHSAEVQAVAFNPRDGNEFLSASADRFAYVWDKTRGTVVLNCTGHQNTVWAVAYSPFNGSVFATASEDRTVRLWAAPATPTPSATPTASPWRAPPAVTLSPPPPSPASAPRAPPGAKLPLALVIAVCAAVVVLAGLALCAYLRLTGNVAARAGGLLVGRGRHQQELQAAERVGMEKAVAARGIDQADSDASDRSHSETDAKASTHSTPSSSVVDLRLDDPGSNSS